MMHQLMKLFAVLGISEQHAMKMMGDKSLDDAKRIIDLCEQNRVSILTKEEKSILIMQRSCRMHW